MAGVEGVAGVAGVEGVPVDPELDESELILRKDRG